MFGAIIDPMVLEASVEKISQAHLTSRRADLDPGVLARGLDAPAIKRLCRRERAVAAFPVVPVLASEKNICHRRQWRAARGGGDVASMIDTRT